MLKPDLSTPELCRKYISEFRLDGEKVGSLVDRHGNVTLLKDATDDQVMKAAEALYHMISRPKGEDH